MYGPRGYDVLMSRIYELQNHQDRNRIVDSATLASSELRFVNKVEQIHTANVFIVAVSTPAFYYEMPNLDSLMAATKDVASQLKPGDTVIFESTVYPGTTEEICLPLLEQISHLKCADQSS